MEEKKDLENNENLLDEKLNEEDINNDVEVLQLNDVNFPLKFLETYNSIIEDTKNKSGLFIHQRMIKEYIKQPNVRGLMIYHELGTGKTLTAISAAIELDRPTIIMCASSIKYNFIKEYGKIKGYEIRPRNTITEIPSNSNELYVYFQIEDWLKLPESIKPLNYGIYNRMLTTLPLLLGAAEIPELSLKDETEVRLWKEL